LILLLISYYNVKDKFKLKNNIPHFLLFILFYFQIRFLTYLQFVQNIYNIS